MSALHLNRRTFCLACSGLASASLASPLVAGTVPRKVSDHSMYEPGPHAVSLSKYRGKVVALGFILTTCPHCQHTCQLLEKLYQEWGPRGFLPVAMAFNPMAQLLIDDFRKDFKLTFPVYFGLREDVNAIAEFDPNQRLLVPQLMIIDRKGIVQFQTPEGGDERVADETKLRGLIEPVLLGKVSAAPPKPATPAKAASATAKPKA